MNYCILKPKPGIKALYELKYIYDYKLYILDYNELLNEYNFDHSSNEYFTIIKSNYFEIIYNDILTFEKAKELIINIYTSKQVFE